MVAVVAVKAQVPAFGWCPDHLMKADFEMDRYLGTWYEAERYLSVLEAGSRCVRTEYTNAKDGRILVANEIQNRLTGIKRVLNGEIRSITKGTEAKLNVKYSTLPYPVETSYTVLDTDYDNYSVVWSCSGLGLFNTQNAWVMTRDQNPTATTLQKAYAVLDKYKISRTFFVKTDQTDCQIAEPADGNDVEAGAEKSADALPVVEAAQPEPVEPVKEVVKPVEPVKEVAEDVVRKDVVVEEVKPAAEPEKVVEKVEVPAAPVNEVKASKVVSKTSEVPKSQ